MVGFTHGKAQGELYLECQVWAENFYCIWRASYRTNFFSPTKGRAFMKNETPPPVSISFSQNASFYFFHLFPLISNGYMFHKKNIKNSASTLHRVIPSKQGVPEINSCAY
jgi:hypothetical protein